MILSLLLSVAWLLCNTYYVDMLGLFSSQKLSIVVSYFADAFTYKMFEIDTELYNRNT